MIQKTINVLSHKLVSVILFGFIAVFSATASDAIFPISKKEFDSKQLERKQEVSIYVPPSYHTTNKSYPVIFVLDGDFLFSTAVNISDIRARRNLMPESIVVGIKTKTYQQRIKISMPMKRSKGGNDISFGDSSPEPFLQFVTKELIPYLNSNYRTVNHKTIIGMSPTGGTVFHDFLQAKSIFDAHISLSAEIGYWTMDDEALTDKLIETTKNKTKAKLYISRGELDFASGNLKKELFTQFDETIVKNKLTDQLHVDVIEHGEHYAASLKSIDNAFNHIFPPQGWRPDYVTIRKQPNPVKALKQFYQDLSNKYGFQTYPTADGYWMGFSIAGTNRYLLRNERAQEAVDMLQWALTLMPNDITLLFNLTAALEENKQLQQALTTINKLVPLAEQQQHSSLSYFQEYQADLEKLVNAES